MGVARNAHARRQAKAMAAPQWRVSDLAGVVVTTQRLWCDLAIGKRLNFNYEEITGFQLDRWSLMLRFRSATPLRVTGAWAPWIAVAVAYHAFGRDQARRLSGMAALRGPGSTAVRAAGTAAVRTSRRTRV
jgi:hypothetical protein